MSGFDIAIHEGYAREEGLDAEMVLMSGTLSAQGITAEQVDFGMSAGALLAARVPARYRPSAVAPANTSTSSGWPVERMTPPVLTE